MEAQFSQIGPAERQLSNYLQMKMEKGQIGVELFEKYNNVRCQVLIDRLKQFKVDRPDEDCIYKFINMLTKKALKLDDEVVIKFLEKTDLCLESWLKIPPEDMLIKNVSEAIEEFSYRVNQKAKNKSKVRNNILCPEAISKETFKYNRKTFSTQINSKPQVFLENFSDDSAKLNASYGVNSNRSVSYKNSSIQLNKIIKKTSVEKSNYKTEENTIYNTHNNVKFTPNNKNFRGQAKNLNVKNEGKKVSIFKKEYKNENFEQDILNDKYSIDEVSNDDFNFAHKSRKSIDSFENLERKHDFTPTIKKNQNLPKNDEAIKILDGSNYEEKYEKSLSQNRDKVIETKSSLFIGKGDVKSISEYSVRKINKIPELIMPKDNIKNMVNLPGIKEQTLSTSRPKGIRKLVNSMNTPKQEKNFKHVPTLQQQNIESIQSKFTDVMNKFKVIQIATTQQKNQGGFDNYQTRMKNRFSNVKSRVYGRTEIPIRKFGESIFRQKSPDSNQQSCNQTKDNSVERPKYYNTARTGFSSQDYHDNDVTLPVRDMQYSVDRKSDGALKKTRVGLSGEFKSLNTGRNTQSDWFNIFEPYQKTERVDYKNDEYCKKLEKKYEERHQNKLLALEKFNTAISSNNKMMKSLPKFRRNHDIKQACNTFITSGENFASKCQHKPSIVINKVKDELNFDLGALQNMTKSARNFGVSTKSMRNLESLQTDTLKMLNNVNYLHTDCKTVISSKNKMERNCEHISKSYKKELTDFKSNLSHGVEKPSHNQTKELMKIRERRDFNHTMANFVMCSFVDKRRTAHACRDTIKNDKLTHLIPKWLIRFGLYSTLFSVQIFKFYNNLYKGFFWYLKCLMCPKKNTNSLVNNINTKNSE